MVREGRAPCSWISMSKRTTGLTFFQTFSKVPNWDVKKTATHACTVFLKVLARWIFGTWRCFSSRTGRAIVFILWNPTLGLDGVRKGNRCSMVQYVYTDSLLVISWNLSLTKETSILSQQKMWHLKLCFFSLEHENNVVVVMVTWFCEASGTHGQCERSLLPSKGAHHCLSCLWQDWWTAANVA